MAVDIIPSRLSSYRGRSHAPIPYTGSPVLLCLADIRLFIGLAWSIAGVLSPVTAWESGALDELYPSLPNLFCLFLHAFLFLFQSLFLISLPFLIVLPLWTVGLYFVAVSGVTAGIAFLLNGQEDILHSSVDLGADASRSEGECWMFLNGVSIGKHWLQSNLNRLALTFRRPITGVHNRTYGIIFDLLQCIVERDFLYATTDIRRSYVTVKASLLEPENKKVILILHSQGGIEGGMILDWLLTELPHDTLHKLEIYTFGSAANHFNNPPRHELATSGIPNPDAIRHIEHYASTGEFVARWGVLYFSRLPNRYAGRVFMRPGTGHLLNQHYLNAMFPLGEDGRVKQSNVFMDSQVQVLKTGEVGGNGKQNEEYGGGTVRVLLGDGEDMDAKVDERVAKGKKARVMDFSRLWQYRDGMVPED